MFGEPPTPAALLATIWEALPWVEAVGTPTQGLEEVLGLVKATQGLEGVVKRSHPDLEGVVAQWEELVEVVILWVDLVLGVTLWEALVLQDFQISSKIFQITAGSLLQTLQISRTRKEVGGTTKETQVFPM